MRGVRPITICGRSWPSTCVVYKRVHRRYKKTKKLVVFVSARRGKAGRGDAMRFEAAAPPTVTGARYADLCRGLSFAAYLTTNQPTNGFTTFFCKAKGKY